MTDLLDAIWDRTFRRAPTLSQERVIEVFQDLDAVLQAAIEVVVRSPVAMAIVMQEAASVAGSLSHGRGIFERSYLDRSPAVPAARVRDTVQWDARPTDLFRNRGRPDADAVQFLESALRLFAAQRAGRMADTLVRSTRLSRASREVVVAAFLRAAGQYDDLAWRIAGAYTEAADQGRLEPIAAAAAAMQEVEADLGCWRADLYGMLVQVRALMDRYAQLRTVIYEPYLRVVYNEARRRAVTGIQTLENFQNGAIGLMCAVSNYNLKRGVFSSYAKTWATQGILLKLKEEANPIKLPAGVWQLAAKIQAIAQRHANNSVDGSYDMGAVALEAGIDVERAEYVLGKVRLNQQHSIDYESGDPDAPSLHDTVAAETPDEPADVHDIVGTMTRDQRRVTFLLHGMADQIDGPVPRDQHVLALERLRQIVAGAVNSRRARGST